MPQFVNEEQIKLSITEETEKINKCVKKWYNTNFPDNLDEFKGCCDKDEKNVLIKCYNIFSKNKNLQVLDDDVIKSLVMYYYIVVVFEDYVHRFIDKKYLKIVKEEKCDDVKRQNLYFLTDNDDNIYTHYRTKYDDTDVYSEIENPVTEQEFYIRSNKNNLRETDPYICHDNKLMKKVLTENHMNCLENMLTTEKSKEYYDLLYRGSADWISQIRRLILNMNTELFEGYKGGKKLRIKNTKKKRNLKKISVKSRKNKGKKAKRG
jgi:hypothetical protein